MTALSRLGEFFVVEPLDGEGWQPLSALLDGPFLDRRVVATHLALTTRAAQAGVPGPGRREGDPVEERVAASIASLGLFARLLAPTLGARLLGIDAPADPHWREQPTGTLPLATSAWGEPDVGAVLTDVVEPLAARLHDEHGVPEQVLAGNASSAVFGSLTMVRHARPDLADVAHDLGVETLTHRYLVGTGDPGPPYVRRSCCLYYRIPHGGYCGDCVLAAR